MSPVEAYAQSNIFRICLLDPGLLAAMADIPARILIEGDRLFTEYKGAFIENLAAATLSASADRGADRDQRPAVPGTAGGRQGGHP